ncbi:hypothetical protein J2854_002499 [Agrobacterium tumefaciens]|nr:hypothetical protein [Agrobacterium tumefaciens]
MQAQRGNTRRPSYDLGEFDVAKILLDSAFTQAIPPLKRVGRMAAGALPRVLC